MRVMVIVKASPESEAGEMPDERILAEMGAFNEELVKAGIMVSGDGLKASSHGARVRFSGTDRMVGDRPPRRGALHRCRRSSGASNCAPMRHTRSRACRPPCAPRPSP